MKNESKFWKLVKKNTPKINAKITKHSLKEDTIAIGVEIHAQTTIKYAIYDALPPIINTFLPSKKTFLNFKG